MLVRFNTWDASMSRIQSSISIDIETFDDGLDKYDLVRIASKRVGRIIELVGRQKRLGVKTQFSMTARITLQIIHDGEILVDTYAANEVMKQAGFDGVWFTFRGITTHKLHTNLLHALEQAFALEY